MPHAILITGANRGIGLELAKQLKASKHIVIGTARNPAEAAELNAVADRVEQLDVQDPASVKALGKALTHIPIDILVNNAGQGPANGGIADLDAEQTLNHLSANTIGPVRVTQAVLPALRKGGERKIVNISSELGSIEGCSGGYYAYRMSKAALNMFTKTIAAELAPEGFTCVSVHPGWVRTRMGGESAPVEVGDSARGLIDVMLHMSRENNGGFFNYLGEAMSW